MENVIGSSVVKSKTVGGDFAKQRFIVKRTKSGDILIIYKTILSDKGMYAEDSRFRVLRKFMGKTLYITAFSIKMSSLSEGISRCLYK